VQAHSAVGHHLRQALCILHQLRQIMSQPAQRTQAFGGAAQHRFRPHLFVHPFFGHGAGRFPNVEIGVQPTAHPFHHHHGLLQQDQLRLGLHVETARGLEQLRQKPGDRNVARALAEDRLADGAQRLGKGLARMTGGHEGELVMQVGDAPVIARQKSRQRARHEAAHARIQPPHDAEIHRRQPPIGVDEQIARMHVGVEKAVAQRLGQKAAHDQHRHRPGIAPSRGQGRRVAHRDAVDPFAGQDRLGGA